MAKGKMASVPLATTKAETQAETQDAATEDTEQPRHGDPFIGLEVKNLKPFTSSKDLPADRVEDRTGTDAGGNVVHTGRTIFCGAPRFYMERTEKGWYNLIGKYRNGKGIGSRNLRTIKPRDMGRVPAGTPQVLVDRMKRDNAIFETLTKLKIPVFMQGHTP